MDWKLYTVHVISRVPSLILHWKSRQERNCRASQPLFWPRLADDLRRHRHGLNECLKQESSGANAVQDHRVPFVKLHSSCAEGAYWWMYYMLFVCLRLGELAYPSRKAPPHSWPRPTWNGTLWLVSLEVSKSQSLASEAGWDPIVDTLSIADNKLCEWM